MVPNELPLRISGPCEEGACPWLREYPPLWINTPRSCGADQTHRFKELRSGLVQQNLWVCASVLRSFGGEKEKTAAERS